MDDTISRVTDEMFDIPEQEVLEAEGVQTYDAYQNDIYEQQRQARGREGKKIYPNGAPARLSSAAQDLIEKARKEYETVMKRYQRQLIVGDTDMAQMTLDSYMSDTVLPLYEALVGFYGVDAVLNASGVLEALDGIVATGNGTGEGYSRAFIEKMYGQFRGMQPSESDAAVVSAVEKISRLVNKDEYRAAVLEAQRINGRILDGEVMASDEDYDFIQNVANYTV